MQRSRENLKKSTAVFPLISSGSRSANKSQIHAKLTRMAAKYRKMKKTLKKGVKIRRGGKARSKIARKAVVKIAAKPKLGKKAAELEMKTNRLLVKGRERGYVTYDEILKEFPTVEEDILFLYGLYEKFGT